MFGVLDWHRQMHSQIVHSYLLYTCFVNDSGLSYGECGSYANEVQMVYTHPNEIIYY